MKKVLYVRCTNKNLQMEQTYLFDVVAAENLGDATDNIIEIDNDATKEYIENWYNSCPDVNFIMTVCDYRMNVLLQIHYDIEEGGVILKGDWNF